MIDIFHAKQPINQAASGWIILECRRRAWMNWDFLKMNAIAGLLLAPRGMWTISIIISRLSDSSADFCDNTSKATSVGSLSTSTSTGDKSSAMISIHSEINAPALGRAAGQSFFLFLSLNIVFVFFFIRTILRHCAPTQTYQFVAFRHTIFFHFFSPLPFRVHFRVCLHRRFDTNLLLHTIGVLEKCCWL